MVEPGVAHNPIDHRDTTGADSPIEDDFGSAKIHDPVTQQKRHLPIGVAAGCWVLLVLD